MMPGGVTCVLDEDKLAECAAAIDGYEAWYEREVLGCSSEEWLALETAEDFDEWTEAPTHRDSALGVSRPSVARSTSPSRTAARRTS